MAAVVAQAMVNGLLIGGIYALVSIGVTLIFGVVKIVNFAQGEFVMIGMYISYWLASLLGMDPVVSLAVSMPALFVIGVVLQRFLIRRVLGLGDMPQIFLTFAVSLLLLNVALLLFTADYRTVQTAYTQSVWRIGPLYIGVARLMAFVLAMLLSAALEVFLRATDLGKAMRAAAQNREVAMLMGVNPDYVFGVAVGLSLALAVGRGGLYGGRPDNPGAASRARDRAGGGGAGAARPAPGRVELVCDRHPGQGVPLRLYRRGVEPPGRLREAAVAGPRRVFRHRRLHVDPAADPARRVALDRHRGRRGGGDAGQPADRRDVLPAAGPVFRHRHHRDGPDLDAAVPQVPRLRLGCRGHHHPQPRQLAVDDAVHRQSRLLLHRPAPAGDRAGGDLLGRTLLDGVLPRGRGRGSGRGGSRRRQRAADQTGHLRNQRVPHRPRRDLLRAVHLLHRSEYRLQLQRLGERRAGVHRGMDRDLVGPGGRHRRAGADLRVGPELARRRQASRGAADPVRGHPDRRDSLAAHRPAGGARGRLQTPCPRRPRHPRRRRGCASCASRRCVRPWWFAASANGSAACWPAWNSPSR